jgi:DNA topoisomerase VI subunit B
MSRTEIEDLREKMMELADEDMKITLSMMAKRARECKDTLKPPKTKPMKFQRPKPEELAKLVDTITALDERAPPAQEVPILSEEVWENLHQSNDESEFWNEIGRIFEVAENASEPCGL